MPMPKRATPLDDKLDAFVGPYMTNMNAPGMTLGLADSEKTVRTAAYGYADLERRLALDTRLLFQIGSITKSFVALVILQLREEGKVDLHKPVLDYLPDLAVRCDFGVITVHHLLTHTSGLPDDLTAFPADATTRLVQGFKPGEHFHYCNAGFEILGQLAAKLDRRPWRECVKARIFEPLEMTGSTGVLTAAERERSAVGYQPYRNDEVYPRQGRLAPAPYLTFFDNTAGCLASNPGDMARYARMLLNRGKGPQGKSVVSEESFALFSAPYIKAPVLSATASYGYGIGLDELDGHKILRHTGGTVAFASSIHVDLDGGVAAFASINAMQGYRPTAVTEYAVRLLRAQRENHPLPEAPPWVDEREIENAADYAGTFEAAAGHTLTFAAQGKALTLVLSGKTIPLQRAGVDTFISTVSDVFSDSSIHFERQAESDPVKKAQAPVAEVSYQEQWFTNAAYTGPHSFPAAPEWAAYVGHYLNDGPWGGDMRVYVLKGRLMLAGEPLEPLGGALFRVGDEAWVPETAEFLQTFQGKARLLRYAGMVFSRVEVD
jgi:CubicO group peptidase (beta-lactamase class C family)